FTLLALLPDGTRPVNVAKLRVVAVGKTKSSAVSISNPPVDSARVAVAIRPSGLPVLKKKGIGTDGLADAGTAIESPSSVTVVACARMACMISPFCNPVLRANSVPAPQITDVVADSSRQTDRGHPMC